MPFADDLAVAMGVPTGRPDGLSGDPLADAFGITNADMHRYGTDPESVVRRQVGAVPYYLLRHSIPFMSAIGNATERRIGSPERIAMQEARDRERQSTWGGYLGDVAAGLPAVAGEAYLGGAALRAVGIAGQAAAGGSLAARAAGFAGRTAAQTAVMPSMYLEDWAQRGGRAQDLPPAFLTGAINTAILGQVGAGRGNLARRIFRGVPVGIAEQQAADVVGSAVSEFLPDNLRLQTGYGTIGQIVHAARGEEDWSNPLKHVLGQALMFGVFAGIHGGDHRAVPQQAAEVSRDAARNGYGRNVAVARVQEVVRRAVEAEPAPENTPGSPRTSDLPQQAAPATPGREVALPAQPVQAPPTPVPEPAPRLQIPVEQLRQVAKQLGLDARGNAEALVQRIERHGGGGFLDAMISPKPAPEQPVVAGAPQGAPEPEPPGAPRGAPEAPIPAPAPEPVAPVLRSPREQLAALMERHLAGDVIDAHAVEPILDAAGLTGRERDVFTRLLIHGETGEEAGTALGVSRERIRQIGKAAAEKLGLGESLADLADKMNAGAEVQRFARVEEMPVDDGPKASKALQSYNRALNRLEGKLNQLVKALERKEKHGRPADAERSELARVSEEIRALDAGQRPGPQAADEAAARAPEGGRDVAKPDDAAAPVAQVAQAESPPRVNAPAEAAPGEAQTANAPEQQAQAPLKRPTGWTRQEVAKLEKRVRMEGLDAVLKTLKTAEAKAYARGYAESRRPEEEGYWSGQAREAGVDPEHLHQAASQMLAEDESARADVTGLIRYLRKQYPALRTIQARNARGIDADAVRGLDDIAENKLPKEFRHLLSGEDKEQQLFNILAAGTPRPMERADAYRQALEYLHEAQRAITPTREDIADVNAQLRRRGEADLRPEEVAAARAEVAGEAVEGSEAEGDVALERGGGSGEDVAIPGVPFRAPGGEVGHARFGAPLAESERHGIGGGQENAAAARPKDLTALANAQRAAERQKNGLDQLAAAQRVSNPQLWDAAQARSQADPAAAQQLVESLATSPRPTSPEETALLLHQAVALRNEHVRTMYQAIEANNAERRAKLAGEGDAKVKDARKAAEDAFARADQLLAQIDQFDRVLKATGTEAGRAFQFRRQLAAEDYSLAGMLLRAEAAKKKPLTTQEREQILKLQEQVATLHEKLGQAEDALRKSGQGVAAPEYGAWQQARVEAMNLRQEFDRHVTRFEWQAMTPKQRAMDLLRKLRLNWVISSPVTAVKIAASSVQQVAVSPVREAIGSALKMLPGVAEVAEKAPIEGRGFNAAVEQRAAGQAMTQGLREGWETLRKGRSELDVLYGKDNARPYTWLDYIGGLHAAEKAPAVRGEYERAFQNIMAHEQQAGREVTSPAALESIGQRAYDQSQRAKFQQDNAVVDGFNKWVSGLKQPDRSAGAKAVGHALDFLLPVRRTPMNIIADCLEHVLGLPVATFKTAMAGKEGRATMPTAQAETIMRQFKRGSLGMGLMLLAYWNPDIVGGLYGGRRTEDELQPGEMNLFGVKLPAWLVGHHPALMAMHVAAAARRQGEAITRGEAHGTLAGTAEAAGALLNEVPFVRAQVDVGSTRGAGRFVESALVPQAVQWLATTLDREEGGSPQQRRPEGVLQSIEQGVPGLRQQVPAGPPRVVADYHLELSRLRQARQVAIRRGERFPDERRFRVLDSQHQNITRLEHAAQGLVQTPRGLVQGPVPDETRARQLRQAQSELAQRLLEAAR